MSDTSIRKDFVDGVHEIFTTLFNEAKTPDDGVQFYAYIGDNDSVYQEDKFKRYASPLVFVCSVNEAFQDGNTDVEAQKRHARFTIPLKDLNNKGIEEMNKTTIANMKKGLMKFRDVWYEIDMIQGKAFIENVYIMWEFRCTEIFDTDSIQIEITEEPEIINLTVKEEES